MKKLATILVVACLILAAGAAARADDLLPPEWRGQPGTTVQEWEFYDPYTFEEPDGDLYYNPYGTPSCSMTSGGWVNQEGSGRRGILYGNSLLDIEGTFTIPNDPDPNNEKLIRVQVTYTGSPTVVPSPVIRASVDDVYYSGELVETVQLEKRPSVDQYWFLDVYDITIPFNPDTEKVHLSFVPSGTGTGYLDQVVIDTYCVPEPASLALLISGGAGLLFRRRRRHTDRCRTGADESTRQ